MEMKVVVEIFYTLANYGPLLLWFKLVGYGGEQIAIKQDFKTKESASRDEVVAAAFLERKYQSLFLWLSTLISSSFSSNFL
jgi:hypothetical protein